MRCHATCRQARRGELDQVSGRRAACEIHTPDDLDETTGVEKTSDLSSREADFDELRSGDEAQLFCGASGEAPFEHDVHEHHQSGAL
jgi:hypothetical protein